MSDEQKYTKLAQKIVYSSIWEEDGDTCKVWITLLGLKRYEDGIVDKNITGIARLAKLPIEKVEEAMKKFESPDPFSTSQEYEGRRIAKVEGGWKVLNHEKYQEYGWSDDKKTYERERKAKWRSKEGGLRPSQSEDPGSQPAAHTSQSNGRLHNLPSTAEEVIAYGATLFPPIPADRCAAFFSYYEGQSRKDPNGNTFWVTKGDAVITNWKIKLPQFATASNQPARKPKTIAV